MSDAQQPEKPQILVDDDWKSQAQAEKEKLAEAEAAAQEESPSTSDPGRTGAGAQGLPKADFRALIGVLVTMVIPYLGGMADRKSGGLVFDPELSRFYIDLLSELEQKTKGNLSDEEERELSAALNELRMRYVELSKLVAQQAAAGSETGGTPGASGPGAG